jgi:hypothetical protein
LRPRHRWFVLNQQRFAQHEYGKSFKLRSYLCFKHVGIDTGDSGQQIDSVWDAPELDYVVWPDKSDSLKPVPVKPNLSMTIKSFATFSGERAD